MAIQNKTRKSQGKSVTVSYSDSINLVKKHVQWSPKGVSLLTKWPFRLGAEVEFAFDHQSERHCCMGVVVACHPLRRPLGFYETVLYFVETPCSELQKAASDCRLCPEHNEGSVDHAKVPAEASTDGVSNHGKAPSSPKRAANARR